MKTNLSERLEVKVVVIDSSSVTVSWNGNDEANYDFSFWEFPLGDPTSFNVKGTHAGIGGLASNRRYTVVVTGGGRQGGTTFVPYQVPEIPIKPKKVRYLGVNFPSETGPQDTIWLKWPVSAGKGVSYKLTYYPTNDPDDIKLVHLFADEYEASGLSLDADGRYVFSLVVSTPDGDSEPTQALTSTLISQRPDQLGNFRTLNRDQTSIEILWSPTAGANSYEISHDKMDRPSIQTENSAKFDNLEPGTRYEFRVAPLSSSGVVGGGSFWEEFTLS
ncbi:fibronectin type III domain-containing protein [Pseudomonas reactans]